MKIAYLLPGSGGSFYCGNCLRDKVFTKSLKQSGHDILMIPMYLPLSIDQCDADSPIFYGAVNIYLEQLSPIFKKMPHWLKKFLDSDKVLRFAAKQSGSTKAEGNESMTISMLQGTHGKQSENLDELIYWLKEHEKPDVVHLSNALLSGLAQKLKQELNCTVVCTLQDEDEWIDEMREPFASQTWKLIESNAAYIDSFIAVSEYYAALIKSKIQIPAEKLHVVYNSIGIDTIRESKHDKNHHTIGYMSKINSLFGADLLFDAFVELKKEKQFSTLKLKYTGGYTDDFSKVVRTIKQKAKQNSIENDVEFFDDLSSIGKNKFLDSISILCVPSRRKEAFAIQVLEAYAAEVPSILPNTGAYPEINNRSNAGLLYVPNDTKNLVNVLRELLTNEVLYHELKQNCHKAIQSVFNSREQSLQIIEIYNNAVFNKK
ncbi:MAG: glycosyltransferase family 4 protein [Paludibacter sp.]|nr:glycosyltransferase family 4 protein [Paludibacter sp.]